MPSEVQTVDSGCQACRHLKSVEVREFADNRTVRGQSYLAMSQPEGSWRRFAPISKLSVSLDPLRATSGCTSDARHTTVDDPPSHLRLKGGWFGPDAEICAVDLALVTS